MNLSPMIQDFVLHFGEMGSRWGINRTVGQIYALLFLSSKPLNADQIVNSLGFSRSNVAMGIKELLAMNLIYLKHMPQDRKDYYETYPEIWDILRNLVDARRKREVDPTLSMLRSVILEKPGTQDEEYAQERMRQMHDLIELLMCWYEKMQGMDNQRMINFLNMGAKVFEFLESKPISKKGGEK